MGGFINSAQGLLQSFLLISCTHLGLSVSLSKTHFHRRFWAASAFPDISPCTDLTVEAAGDTLKVLLMSDFHLTAGKNCIDEDVPEPLRGIADKDACAKATKDFIDKLTSAYVPLVDLIVINGDIIEWNAVDTKTDDLTHFLTVQPGYLANFVTSVNTQNKPVVVTFGNHDSAPMQCANKDGVPPSALECDLTQGKITVDQEIRMKRWKSVQKLFTSSAHLCTAQNTHGVGNTVVTAKVNGKRIPLFFVDSGAELSFNKAGYSDTLKDERLYDWVRPSQVDWMRGVLSRISDAPDIMPGLIFTHHPPALTTASIDTMGEWMEMDSKIDILSSTQRWALHSNQGKPDQGQKANPTARQQKHLQCRPDEAPKDVFPTLQASGFSEDFKRNWQLKVKASKDDTTTEECPAARGIFFYDGASLDVKYKNHEQTLIQLAASSPHIAALFSGHHHDNDFCATPPAGEGKGSLAFCYGGTAGYSAATHPPAKASGPRPRGAILERQVRLLSYKVPTSSSSADILLKTGLVKDIFGTATGLEFHSETVLPVPGMVPTTPVTVHVHTASGVTTSTTAQVPSVPLVTSTLPTIATPMVPVVATGTHVITSTLPAAAPTHIVPLVPTLGTSELEGGAASETEGLLEREERPESTEAQAEKAVSGLEIADEVLADLGLESP